jgi:S-DNA-T family DNA segregation ATPase FtsK/SpoIIIE
VNPTRPPRPVDVRDGPVFVLMVLAQSWQRWAALVGATVVFGIVGTPKDKPLLDVAVVKPRVRKLTVEVLAKAN